MKSNYATLDDENFAVAVVDSNNIDLQCIT